MSEKFSKVLLYLTALFFLSTIIFAFMRYIIFKDFLVSEEAIDENQSAENQVQQSLDE